MKRDRAAALGLIVSVAASGCTKQILDDLDQLDNETWVDVSTAPSADLNSVAYGVGIAYGGGDQGVTLYVLGESPTGFARVEYSESGVRAVTGTTLQDVEEPPLDTSLPITGDPIGEAVAIGFGTSTQARIALVDGITGDLESDFALADGGDFPASVDIGLTGAGAPDEADLVATVGDQVVVVPDYLGDPAPATTSCTFAGETLGSILVADASGEILVARDGDVAVLTAADVDQNDACPAGTPIDVARVTAMAGGDFAGDGTADDVAFLTPDSLEVLSGADGSMESIDAAGATLAAGDFDGDGTDDLAVGDPSAATEGKSGAGVVYLVLGGETTPAATLYDAAPARDEAFGRALGVALFDGSIPLLAVGTGDSEVFTYFRLPLDGSVDPRTGR